MELPCNLPKLNLSSHQIDELQEYFDAFARVSNSDQLVAFLKKSTKHFWRYSPRSDAAEVLLNVSAYPTLYTDIIPWLSSLFSRVREIFSTPLRLLEQQQAMKVDYTLEQLVVILSLMFFGMSPVTHTWHDVSVT
jgi:hypothetical protein